MVQEIVLADGSHVRANALAPLAMELFQRDSLPLRGRLHNLGIDGVFVVIVGNMERDRRARSIPVQHVIHTAFHVHDQRHLDHHQVEFFTEVIFDVPFYLEDRLLGFFLGQQGTIVGRENLLQFVVVANPRACKVSLLV